MIEEEKNHIILSEELRELNIKRKEILYLKKISIEKQNYEEAAKLRGQEKEIKEQIIKLIKNQIGEDFLEGSAVGDDVIKILDLVEPWDLDFSKAILRLEKIDYERIVLIKKIEKFIKEEITIDELHNSIQKALESVKENTEQKIKKYVLEYFRNDNKK